MPRSRNLIIALTTCVWLLGCAADRRVAKVGHHELPVIEQLEPSLPVDVGVEGQTRTRRRVALIEPPEPPVFNTEESAVLAEEQAEAEQINLFEFYRPQQSGARRIGRSQAGKYAAKSKFAVSVAAKGSRVAPPAGVGRPLPAVGGVSPRAAHRSGVLDARTSVAGVGRSKAGVITGYDREKTVAGQSRRRRLP